MKPVIRFYEPYAVSENAYLYAVIVARYRNQWVLVRHKERETWEIPGGHKEAHEGIDETAARELTEQTGASAFDLLPVCAYSVDRGEGETFGHLFFAEIHDLGALPESEIAEVRLMDDLPNSLTYPDIQPALFEKVKSVILPESK
ncbi:MAG: NUDIX hydrolase [Christensenellales bacterium]|jgi:8-oxo-dGTP diphosphatase